MAVPHASDVTTVDHLVLGAGLTVPIQCCILTAAYRDVMYSGPVDSTFEIKPEPMAKS